MGTKEAAIFSILLLASLSASAQGIGDPPFHASTRTTLNLRADAPHWWSRKLPREVGILEQNATVRVLREKKFGTIFGKQIWYQVEVVKNPQIRKQPTPKGTTGWIFGGSDGERLQHIPPA